MFTVIWSKYLASKCQIRLNELNVIVYYNLNNSDCPKHITFCIYILPIR